jgi:hypothetical protein
VKSNAIGADSARAAGISNISTSKPADSFLISALPCCASNNRFPDDYPRESLS